MKRHQRRTAASKQARLTRAATISAAADYLADAGPTAIGATLMMPDGETLYLDAQTARAMQAGTPTKEKPQ